MHYPGEIRPYFLLSSVSVGMHPGYSFEEISTEYIYSIDLDTLNSDGVSNSIYTRTN